MKNVLGTIALSAILLLMCPAKVKTQVGFPTAPNPQPNRYARELAEIAQTGLDLTLWQTRRVIVAVFLSSSNFSGCDPGSFRFNSNNFEFDATPLGHSDSQQFSMDLTTLPKVIAKRTALLYAELKYYSEAIHHMRAYLELVPDASDAQQARDQIILWQAELKKGQ